MTTHKERTKRALLRQEVDRLPTQIKYTTAMGESISRYFGISQDQLPQFLDNHMIRVDLSYDVTKDERLNVWFDWWGAGHDKREEGYYISVRPLQASKDLESFHWPDPNDPGLMRDAIATVAEYGDEYFITPNFGWALFERAWSLRGFDTFLMDMAMDPAFTHALLDRIVEIQLDLIQRFIEAGVDGAYFGDDYGAQKNLLFSPAMWREFIKPRLARMFEPFLARGMPIIMHSDGQIQPILNDLVEIGLTTLNPVQPEVIGHEWLAREFGDQLTFYGGISTQTVLPNGTPSEVKAAVQRCASTLAGDQTGLLISPSHSLMTDIPLENVEAVLEAFREL